MKLDLSKEEHQFYLILTQVWVVAYSFAVVLGRRMFRARRTLCQCFWQCRNRKLSGATKKNSFVVTYK